MRMSHSRVDTFKQCPHKFKLQYIDGLVTYPDYDPANPLIIGTAFHMGIEQDVETAIAWYHDQFPLCEDKHVEEAIKLEYVINKAREILPWGEHEQKIEVMEPYHFIGFMDLLVPVEDGVFDLYDFKYSNNVEKYTEESAQLHVYKTFFEQMTGKSIRKMFFVFAPKVGIRLKKTETIEQFRIRLRNELESKEIQVREVEYNKAVVQYFNALAESIPSVSQYPKHPSRLCDWCDFKGYCQDGDDYQIDWETTYRQGVDNMALPENRRTPVTDVDKLKIWIYGTSFSGKTWLANQAPNPIFLSTDGNYKNLPGGIPPHVDLVDEVWTEGRQTKRKHAWEVLKETITDLEKGGNTFETVILDTVNQTRELCRTWFFASHGIEHESDASYGKGFSMIDKEFNDTMARLCNLGTRYNVILISHMDMSGEVTKKSGDKISIIEPTNSKKYKYELASRVDMVIRLTGEDDKYTMSFKNNEFIFGGGRLGVNGIEDMPTSWNGLCEIFNEYRAKLNATVVPSSEPVQAPKEEPQPTEPVEVEMPAEVQETPEQPVRRQRRRKTTEE